MDYINRIYNEDCIAGMSRYPDRSIDMILCDLPYGMTDCRWDSVLPLGQLWEQYLRIIKPNGAIALTSCQPFTTKLISSNPKHFKYCWYWYKNMVTGFANAKKQPLRCVEEICIFYQKQPVYNPQGIMILDHPVKNCGKKDSSRNDNVYKVSTLSKDTETYVTHYPRQVLEMKCQREGLHPTQKPVELFEYLIRTYTNPGELVLDNCMGSGTTAIACLNAGRNYTGFEWERQYYETIRERIGKHQGGERLC